MKLFITTLVITANIFFISCKKSRTCSCKTENTNTTVTTPRSSGQPSTTTNSNSGESSSTYSKVKKSDLTRLYDCNNRSQTSSNTYTTTTIVYTPTTIGGYTFNVPTSVPADVVSTQVNNYTSCEIK